MCWHDYEQQLFEVQNEHGTFSGLVEQKICRKCGTSKTPWIYDWKVNDKRMSWSRPLFGLFK